jgi:GDP/UDP-N,N'-diacetylbacillosamine 2-epimerase (hydrolysing)
VVKQRRKLCVVSGSRAEYGLLKPLLEEICADPELALQLVVTGMHLSPEFGSTHEEIEEDGFPIAEKVEILLDSNTPVGVTKSVGLAIISFSEIFHRLKPDICILLGDRFEIFAVAAAALIAKVPVAHLHGGEVTEGAIDDAFRHAITKMSHLHFVATEPYRKRVIQLGENPQTVFTVGAIGLDNINRVAFLTRKELERSLDIRFMKHNLLITYHPSTLVEDYAKEFRNLLSVLGSLRETLLLFTKSNADAGGRELNRIVDRFIEENPTKTAAFVSLGRTRYLSLMRAVDAVVGNSSSGIIEAPSFGIGTVNIGSRQTGRIKAKSVIDCSVSRPAIQSALERLYQGDFQSSLKKTINPYGDGHTAPRITAVLAGCDLKGIINKKFFDLQGR